MNPFLPSPKIEKMTIKNNNKMDGGGGESLGVTFSII
jgi:hypothetical protein